MAATATAPKTADAASGLADLIAGVIVEVQDLAATRAFYEPIFRDVAGEWQAQTGRLRYAAGSQSIEFVRRGRPRTFPDGGFHQGYRVRRSRLAGLADQLAESGHEVSWWREDNPAEQEPTAYLRDPSGNRVQLVASDQDPDLLLDHAAIEVHAFDYCEHVYRKVLGGEVAYYHGWRVEDEEDAKRWGRGEDPCAPWTRRDNPGWHDFARLGTTDRNLRVPRPATQVFLRFGKTSLGLISAGRVRQELPEEIIKGLPRLVFRSSLPAEQAFTHIQANLPLPWEREGRTAYIRDPDGNFAEVRAG